MRIQINYHNPSLPRGPVGGTPVVPLNSNFRFFSNDGTLEVQFKMDSPLTSPNRLDRLPAETDFAAQKAGRFRFTCFLDGNELPDGGGEIEVPPPGA